MIKNYYKEFSFLVPLLLFVFFIKLPILTYRTTLYLCLILVSITIAMLVYGLVKEGTIIKQLFNQIYREEFSQKKIDSPHFEKIQEWEKNKLLIFIVALFINCIFLYNVLGLLFQPQLIVTGHKYEYENNVFILDNDSDYSIWKDSICCTDTGFLSYDCNVIEAYEKYNAARIPLLRNTVFFEKRGSLKIPRRNYDIFDIEGDQHLQITLVLVEDDDLFTWGIIEKSWRVKEIVILNDE